MTKNCQRAHSLASERERADVSQVLDVLVDSFLILSFNVSNHRFSTTPKDIQLPTILTSAWLSCDRSANLC